MLDVMPYLSFSRDIAGSDTLNLTPTVATVIYFSSENRNLSGGHVVSVEKAQYSVVKVN